MLAIEAGNQNVNRNLLPTATSMPVYDFAIEMGPATHFCSQCSIEVMPSPLTDSSVGWIMFPCHESECSCCYEIGIACPRCDKIEDACCDCSSCSYCSALVDSEDICSECSECESCCSCSKCSGCDAKGNSVDFCGRCSDYDNVCVDCCICSSYLSPGWDSRNLKLPTHRHDFLADMESEFRVSPVESMADFYVCDWVLAVIPETNSDALSVNLRRDALRLQNYLIGRLDFAFRSYGFVACGGESRHHCNVNSLPMGREDCFDYFYAIGLQNDRVALLEDLVEIFGCDSWSSGYGGRAWQGCAEILLARETGNLDAKTFVDRVFSLQHNGGSFLNKVGWMASSGGMRNVDYCQAIGNAHAARNVDFDVLLRDCSIDAFQLAENLLSVPNLRCEEIDIQNLKLSVRDVRTGSSYSGRYDLTDLLASEYSVIEPMPLERIYEARADFNEACRRVAYWQDLGYEWSEEENDFVRADFDCECG